MGRDYVVKCVPNCIAGQLQFRVKILVAYDGALRLARIS